MSNFDIRLPALPSCCWQLKVTCHQCLPARKDGCLLLVLVVCGVAAAHPVPLLILVVPVRTTETTLPQTNCTPLSILDSTLHQRLDCGVLVGAVGPNLRTFIQLLNLDAETLSHTRAGHAFHNPAKSRHQNQMHALLGAACLLHYDYCLFYQLRTGPR